MIKSKKSHRLFLIKTLFLTLTLALLSPLINPLTIRATTNNIGEAFPIIFKEARFLSTSALYKFIAGESTEEVFSETTKLLPPKGIWSAIIEGDDICFRFDHSDRTRNSYWMQSECFARTEFGQLPRGQDGEFKLEREAGTILFKGKFENEEGLGRHTFTENASFKSYLGQQGYTNIEENTMFSLFLLDFSKSYLAYLKQINMTPSDSRQLRKLSHHGLPLSEMKKTMADFRALSYTNISLNEFVEIQIHDVTPAYVKAMAKAGFKNLSIAELKQASIHDVDPAYVADLKSAGFSNLTLKETVQMAIHDVDAQFVKDLNQMGYKNLTVREVKNAAIHDVSSAYVRDLQSAGFDNLSLNEVIQFSIHDVDARFVKALANMGYKGVSADEIRNAAIHDVDARYIESLNALGFKDIPLRKIINLKIHDVTVSFIKLAQSKGLDGLSLDEYKNLKIHGLEEKLRKSREK